MNTATRVLCIDDRPDITLMLSGLIGSEPGFECVGCLQSVDNLAEEVRQRRPDLLLLDATIPGEEPLDAMRKLASDRPDIKTVVYSGYKGSELVSNAIKAGAWGCVSKDEAPEAVMRLLRDVAAGHARFPIYGTS